MVIFRLAADPWLPSSRMVGFRVAARRLIVDAWPRLREQLIGAVEQFGQADLR
jgi:hypothetical protein